MFGTNSIRQVIFAVILATTICMLPKPTLADATKPTVQLVSFAEAPYVFDTKQQKQGLVEKVIYHLFQSAGINYSLRLMPKKRAILFAEQTPATCVFPIERSQEREVKFTWISPILITTTGLFQVVERPISKRFLSLSDVEGYRIGSHLGSATGEYLKSMGYKVDMVPKNPANIHKLKAKRIDLWESDSITANYIAKQNGINIGPSELDFFTHLKAIGCNLETPKNSVSKIRSALKELYKSGLMGQIYDDFTPQ